MLQSAEGYAYLGGREEAREILSRAADQATSAGEPPSSVYWYTEPFFRLNIGLAQLSIGEFTDAADSLRTGIRPYLQISKTPTGCANTARPSHAPAAAPELPALDHARPKDVLHASCSPVDPSQRPDCYRRVTEFSEPPGALGDVEPKPVGVEDIRG